MALPFVRCITGLFLTIPKLISPIWLKRSISFFQSGQKISTKQVSLYALINAPVNAAVKATYQSYVEGLKGTDAWTKEAQEKALQMALETAKAELTAGAKAYIEKYHGDINKYIATLIESILYDLKK